MRSGSLIAILVALVALIGAVPVAADDDEKKRKEEGEGVDEPRIRAPEIPEGLAWLNTGRPLSLRELRGRVVLLDFWTYCCINCIHVIPDLKFLEEKYRDAPLVVIGVHSAKFENEGEAENIRQAVLRYEVKHPVVVDKQMRVWGSYAVRSWPTLVLIDPEGYVVGGVSGEGHRERLDRVIGLLLKDFGAKGLLAKEPLALVPERLETGAGAASSPLRFPGKVRVDAARDRIYIADSNHNRIVGATLAGKHVATAGSGRIGREDGPLGAASFDHPQGMTIGADGSVYVADTENHLIRRIDWAKGTVETVAGTGVQAPWRSRGGAALASPISSPWDLLRAGEKVYIAMAGPHQIWQLDLAGGTLSVLAGTGREACIDGPRAESAFAQPSGLATDGKRLFVADSEVSTVRAVDLPGAGEAVKSVAGSEDLFGFGDEDGVGDAARLQHCLGVAFAGGTLYVADTYNHKVRRIDPAARRIERFLGTGKPGRGLEPLELYEPGGLDIDADGARLYIADTNNHRIIVHDLAAKKSVELALEGVPAPAAAAPAKAAEVAEMPATRVPTQTLKPGTKVAVRATPSIPLGEKLAPETPIQIRVRSAGGAAGLVVFEAGKTEAIAEGKGDRVEIALATGPAAAPGTAAILDIEVSYMTCDLDAGPGAACRPRGERYSVAVRLDPAGSTTIDLPAAPEDR